MINKKLVMDEIIKIEDLSMFNLKLSELLHAIKYNDFEKYSGIYNYNVRNKEDYTKIEY